MHEYGTFPIQLIIIDCPIDYGENMKLTHHLEELMKEI